jgi:hypothetical protein
MRCKLHSNLTQTQNILHNAPTLALLSICSGSGLLANCSAAADWACALRSSILAWGKKQRYLSQFWNWYSQDNLFLKLYPMTWTEPETVMGWYACPQHGPIELPPQRLCRYLSLDSWKHQGFESQKESAERTMIKWFVGTTNFWARIGLRKPW